MGIFATRGIALLAIADIQVNGDRPWDLQTYEPEAFFRKVFTGGSLAFCEAYMDGKWDCKDLFGLLRRLFAANIHRSERSLSDWILDLRGVWNQQTKKLSLRVAENHYDLSNNFYRLWLDPSMTYSSARWDGVDNLEAAQSQKRRHIADKLYLEPGMSVWDIGCGWGALAKDLAANHGAVVTGVTLSQEQATVATQVGRGHSVRILKQDYRDVNECFDRIVSVGMLEHVGVGNYDTYMKVAAANLKPHGLFVCHAIVGKSNAKDPFLDRYIFPGGELGSTWQVQKAAEENGFKVEDWENFGYDYYLTLMAWNKNFTDKWDEIEPLIGPKILKVFGSRERFRRGWKMYLLGCAAMFHERVTSVGQWVLSKDVKGKVYKGVRL